MTGGNLAPNGMTGDKRNRDRGPSFALTNVIPVKAERFSTPALHFRSSEAQEVYS
ncbi:hypothetical protein LMG28138_05080 [Pararobbsia alpina]|uniref:Uncharacterized protein n=1 Tax=Pararobbsia alpina TaxID=621374 RepID=A0A6S7DCV1_9BURK|nr:hypothetical protein LMG28138_05080 [Pararobbsia alpina]